MCNVRIDVIKTGENIAVLRKNRNITVKKLQEELGFNTPQAIYKWTRGETLPSVDNLVILANVLNTTIDNILVVEK